MRLAEQNCRRIEPGEKPLKETESAKMFHEIPNWSLKNNMLEREFHFKSFLEAMKFVNRIATIAEGQDHHPDICVYYDKVYLMLSTHKINGLSTNDFILAAKIDVFFDNETTMPAPEEYARQKS